MFERQFLKDFSAWGAIMLQWLDCSEREKIFPALQNTFPNIQFIVSTHSPFIAASFEPEERFILYFDDNQVKVRRGNSPIGDDPNDILANDFGIIHRKDLKKHEKLIEYSGNILKETESCILQAQIQPFTNRHRWNE